MLRGWSSVRVRARKRVELWVGWGLRLRSVKRPVTGGEGGEGEERVGVLLGTVASRICMMRCWRSSSWCDSACLWPAQWVRRIVCSTREVMLWRFSFAKVRVWSSGTVWAGGVGGAAEVGERSLLEEDD